VGMSSKAFVPGGVTQQEKRSVLARIFSGDAGPRVWWRLLLFVFITVAGARLLGELIVHFHLFGVGKPPGEMTPVIRVLVQELVFVIPAVLAALLMTRIERRPMTSYGLSVGTGQELKMLPGIVWGVGMMTSLMLLIRVFGGVRFDGLAIHGRVLVESMVLYGIGFLLVGFFEEFTFRGYMQQALGERIGFWPAAGILSALFGIIHLGNGGESWVGALMAALFGIVSCLALERTGGLWLSIGMHAGFDYAETLIYGVPDGGFPAKNALMNAVLHGPNWLTGGSVGPEASTMAFVMLAAAFALMWMIYPRRAFLERERKVV
jgi:membrane protease YdiL (CAAX protease family)